MFRYFLAASAIAAASMSVALADTTPPIPHQQEQFCQIAKSYSDAVTAYGLRQAHSNAIQAAQMGPAPNIKAYDKRVTALLGPSGMFTNWIGTFSAPIVSNNRVSLNFMPSCENVYGPGKYPPNLAFGNFHAVMVEEYPASIMKPWDKEFEAKGYGSLSLTSPVAKVVGSIPTNSTTYVRISGRLFYKGSFPSGGEPDEDLGPGLAADISGAPQPTHISGGTYLARFTSASIVH